MFLLPEDLQCNTKKAKREGASVSDGLDCELDGRALLKWKLYAV